MACKHCHAHADHGHDHGRGHDEHEVDGSETAEQDREEEEEDPKRALRKGIVSAVLLLAAYLIELVHDHPLPTSCEGASRPRLIVWSQGKIKQSLAQD